MNPLIEEIRRIRAKNNVPWMEILDIALEARPRKTREVLRQIFDNDVKVTDLTARLCTNNPRINGNRRKKNRKP